MFKKNKQITVIGLPVDTNQERNLNSGYSGTYFRELIKMLDAYDQGYRTRYGINKFGENYNIRVIKNELKRIAPTRYSKNLLEEKKEANEISELLKYNLRRIKKNYSKNISMNNNEHRPLKKSKTKNNSESSHQAIQEELSKINPEQIQKSIKSIVRKSRRGNRK